MVSGGVCDYHPLVTQLAAAVEFIRTHRVVLITLSIGGDNVPPLLLDLGHGRHRDHEACVRLGLSPSHRT